MAIQLSLTQPNGTTPTFHKLWYFDGNGDNNAITVKYKSFMDEAHCTIGAQGMDCIQTSNPFTFTFSQFGGASFPTEAQLDAAIIALPNSPLAGGTVVS